MDWQAIKGKTRAWLLTRKNILWQRLGWRHPMLPNKVFYLGKNGGWKWTSGHAILNKDWLFRIEGDDDKTREA